MKKASDKKSAWWLLLLALGGLLFAGCGTVEGDSKNMSSRPWNRPYQWETGLPSGMFEGR